MTSFTRRELLGYSGACVLSGLGPLAVAGPTFAQAQKKASTTAATWMDEWMNNRTAVSGPLFITRFREPIYVLLKPISWKPTGANTATYSSVEVPAGFVTDFASIPRVFWSLLRPDAEYTYPAIIHDYLYWMQERPREVADNIFRLAMEDFKIETITATAIFKAIRAGGGSAWNSNARLKNKGEKRVLKDLPDDPTVRWQDWKKKPGVFAT